MEFKSSQRYSERYKQIAESRGLKVVELHEKLYAEVSKLLAKLAQPKLRDEAIKKLEALSIRLDEPMIVQALRAKKRITDVVKSKTQYIYRTELHEPLYRKTVTCFRFGIPKAAYWEYWHDDEWQPGTGPNKEHKWTNRKPPLFNLPVLYESQDSDEPIYWVEGEECCKELTKLELVSTCHPIGSAGEWRNEYGFHLTNRPVYFFPDNDEPGYKHVNAMAREAFKFASEVRVVTPWQTEEQGYDIKDWIKENKKRSNKWLRKHIKEFVAQAEPMSARTSSPIERFDVAGIEKLKDPDWLVSGIIPLGGLIVIPAPFEVGKTFFALSIARAVQAGKSWLNVYKVKQRQVAYVWAEGDIGDLKLRVAVLKKGLKGEQLENFMEFEAFIGQPLIDTQDGLANILVALDTLAISPGLVIFDTKARTMAGSENVGEDQAAYIRAADTIRARYNCTVIVNDHTPLADQTRHRGHQSLGGAADTQISIEKNTSQSEGTAKISCTKSRRGKRFEDIYIEFKLIHLDGERSSLKLSLGLEENFQPAQKSKQKSNESRLLEILEKNPTLSIRSLSEWATLASLTDAQARKAADRLRIAGKVKTKKDGKSNIWSLIQ